MSGSDKCHKENYNRAGESHRKGANVKFSCQRCEKRGKVGASRLHLHQLSPGHLPVPLLLGLWFPP